MQLHAFTSMSFKQAHKWTPTEWNYLSCITKHLCLTKQSQRRNNCVKAFRSQSLDRQLSSVCIHDPSRKDFFPQVEFPDQHTRVGVTADIGHYWSPDAHWNKPSVVTKLNKLKQVISFFLDLHLMRPFPSIFTNELYFHDFFSSQYIDSRNFFL